MRNTKALIGVTILITLLNINIYAASEECTISIPTFDIAVNDYQIDSTTMEYPLIVYRDITYFPLTWNWCTEMGLVSGFTATDGLYITNYSRSESSLIDQFDGGGNQKAGSRFTATKPDYPVYINGNRIDNDNEPYPLLNFRGVTYFPLTWRFAVDEFGWDMSWNDENGFLINRTGLSLEPGTDYKIINSYTQESYRDYSILKKNIEYRSIDTTPSESGGYTDRFVDKSEELYRLEYSMNEISAITLVDVSEQPYNNGIVNGVRVDTDIKVVGSMITYQDDLLIDLSGALGQTESVDYFTATAYEANGMKVISLIAYFTSNGQSVPAPYTPQKYYAFIDYGTGEFQRLDEWSDNQYPTHIFQYALEGIYICSDYSTYSGSRFSNSKGFVIQVLSDETVTIMNDLWIDWNSIKALGMDDNGTLYLLNTWCPDEEPFFGSGQISPIRDGYFALDINGELSKIFPFIQSDKTVVTPSGSIYLDVGRKDSILHLQSGTWIQP